MGEKRKSGRSLAKKPYKKIGSLILMSGGVFLVLLGLGELVAEIFRWHSSVSHVFVGFVAIIAAILYKKS